MEEKLLSPLLSILAFSSERSLFFYFSIRIRASTANKPLSVATNGFISISFISLAKRNKVEANDNVRILLLVDTLCPRVPLMIGYPLKRTNH